MNAGDLFVFDRTGQNHAFNKSFGIVLETNQVGVLYVLGSGAMYRFSFDGIAELCTVVHSMNKRSQRLKLEFGAIGTRLRVL